MRLLLIKSRVYTSPSIYTYGKNALAPVALLVSADVGFAINILVLVPSDRRMTILRCMFVGAVVGGAKAMAGCAVMTAVGETILVTPMSRRIR